MDIGQEFVLSLFIQLLILAFFVGIYVATIKFMGQQINDLKSAIIENKKEMEKKLDTDRKDLEQKLAEDRKDIKDEMKKYNNVLERMIITEQSAKSAHHRMDDFERRFN